MSNALHLKWEELTKDSPMPKLWRRRVIGENMMLSQVFLEKGCEVPRHAHANEQFACILQGKLRFQVESLDNHAERTVDVGAGEILVLPANVPHAAIALEDTLVLDVFSPPSQTTGIDKK